MIDKIKLNDGNKMPLIGITANKPFQKTAEKDKVLKNCLTALKSNHLMFQFSSSLKILSEMAEIINQSKKMNNELFITNKLWSNSKKFDEKETISYIEKSMKELGISKYDMLLIEGSVNKEIDLKRWSLLEKLKQRGYTKSIGLSMFELFDLRNILNNSKTIPSYHEYEISLTYFNQELFLYSTKHNIVNGSLAPINNLFLIGEKGTESQIKKVEEVSKTYKLTKKEVLLSFLLGTGVVSILNIEGEDEDIIKGSEELFNNSNLFHRIYTTLMLESGRRRSILNPDSV